MSLVGTAGKHSLGRARKKRVEADPEGHALLLGRGGSSRQGQAVAARSPCWERAGGTPCGRDARAQMNLGKTCRQPRPMVPARSHTLAPHEGLPKTVVG